MSRPRLLVVTPWSPMRLGGAEKVVREVGRRLVTAGLPVRVLCADPELDEPQDFELDGVHIRTLPGFPRGRDWLWTPRLWKEMAAARPDLVHVHSYHTLVPPLGMLRCRDLGIPYVVTFHGGGSSSRLRTAARMRQRQLQRPLYTGAARLIAVAQFEVDAYGRELGIPADHFIVIPNGADLPAPGTGGERHQGPVPQNGDATIASVGRLEMYKGHHRVIAAMPDLVRRRPLAQLLIVGRGPEEAALRRRAEETGVGEHIQFTSVPAADSAGMAQLLAEIDLVALMSEFESHPLAAIEAAGAGCRLVVADCAGLGELARGGVGRAVPLTSTPGQLADAIDDALSRAAPLPAKRFASWDDCARAHLDLYRGVLGVSGSDTASTSGAGAVQQP